MIKTAHHLVSQNELDGVLLNFGEGVATRTAAAVIPEPTNLTLLSMGGLSLICRRVHSRPLH